MAVATIGAICINELAEAVTVMLFYQIGELFQDYAVNKSRKSIAELMDIRPDYANVIREDKHIKINPTLVKVGEIILVKPGEKIPLDGIVVEGTSMLNTLALTGESVPRRVSVNDEVLSGCINNDGILKIKVTKNFNNSTVSKILDLVESASDRKAKTETFVAKAAKVYTPLVLILAVLVAILLPLLFNVKVEDAIYRALVFLVISCPCAIAISVPLSYFSGIGKASKDGILVKGSDYLDALGRINKIICNFLCTFS